MPKGENNKPGKSTSMDEHVHEALIEDVEFLLDTGVSIDLICKRLNKKKDTLEQAYRRRGRRAPWLQPLPQKITGDQHPCPHGDKPCDCFNLIAF